jgi:hypothetical protein
MSPEADGGATAVAVLADLRRARRRRRAASIDWFEALYRAYLTAVLAGVAVWLGSGLVGDHRVGAHTAAQVAARGPAVVGLVVALAWAIGLRSGGRGGPLVIEAADVRHVLMSPVDRRVALRGPALRQLRFSTAAALGAGAVAGLLAYHRLPGNAVAWIAAGAATGAAAVLGGYGAALVVSGRRAGARMGSLLAVALVAWSVADVLEQTTTSPATLVGQLALWPLRFRPGALGGVAVAAALAGLGLATVGGCSIEAAERRASLVGQIRFAATLQDLRTVIVLRRQLAQELPRQRPWVRLPRSVTPGRPGSGRARALPAWRRGWHGILRFPAIRLARMVALGALAGASLVGVWRGTTALVLAAGLALYLAALDAVEPVAQELDHPDRLEAYPEEAGLLALREAGPSAAVMALVALVGVAAAVAASGGSRLALGVGLALVAPAALGALGGALVSVVQGAPQLVRSSDSFLPPEMTGIRSLLRSLIPPAVAVIGVLPVLGARHPPAHIGPAQAAASDIPEVLVVVAAIGLWVRYRERLRASLRASMQEATGSRGPGGAV